MTESIEYGHIQLIILFGGQRGSPEFCKHQTCTFQSVHELVEFLNDIKSLTLNLILQTKYLRICCTWIFTVLSASLRSFPSSGSDMAGRLKVVTWMNSSIIVTHSSQHISAPSSSNSSRFLHKYPRHNSSCSTVESMPTIKVGILGATGTVGQRFITLLSTHPWFIIHALGASPANAGKAYSQAVKWKQTTPLPHGISDVHLEECKPENRFAECGLVFSGLDADVAYDIGSRLFNINRMISNTAQRAHFVRQTVQSSPMPSHIAVTRTYRSSSHLSIHRTWL